MNRKYSYVVGTGGVGKGILFKLEGLHLLGKNESRLAELTDYADYCKLHIILHYVASYVGEYLPVYAIGRIGNDEVGQELLQSMRKAGIHTEHMRITPDKRTLYSVCYQYPDGEGGNLTASNSASDSVSQEDILDFFRSSRVTGRGMVLAAPEVPIEARVSLLKEGRKRDCFNIASVLSGEIKDFNACGGFELTDLLVINQDEAEAVASFSNSQNDKNKFLACYDFLREQNPDMVVVMTCGKEGAFTYHKGKLQHTDSIPTLVVNSAGSGDCFLGTIMAGMIKGIPLIASEDKEGALSTAQDIASAAAAMKIRCNDTIDFSINRNTLWEFIKEKGLVYSEQICRDFFEINKRK